MCQSAYALRSSYYALMEIQLYHYVTRGMSRNFFTNLTGTAAIIDESRWDLPTLAVVKSQHYFYGTERCRDGIIVSCQSITQGLYIARMLAMESGMVIAKPIVVKDSHGGGEIK